MSKKEALSEYPPLDKAALGWVTFALAAAAFMQVLDSTIANVAIPTIAGNLGASPTQGTWVITSFGVASAIALPLTGWLAKRIGEVRLFLWSTTLFTLASLLCGFANSLPTLIVARVIQGAVAGPLIPLSQTLLLVNYPPAKRGVALSLWSMTVVVAPIFGPILGGYISDNYHWGWIFFINVPIGGGVVLLVWSLLKDRESPTAYVPTNVISISLLVLGVGCLQLMLDRGKELDWFNSTEIIVLAVVSVMALTYLIIWELTDKHPVVDFSLFKFRNFTIGVMCISLGMMIYFGTIVLIPLLLQTQLGYTATSAGLAAAPIGIIPVLLAPYIGRNLHRVDIRFVASFSFIVFAACFFWRTTFSPDMDFRWVALPQFAQGIAVACFMMPLTTMALAGIHPDRMADASSLSNFLRTLAASIGTSVTTTLWEQREALHHSRLSEFISIYNPISNGAFARLESMGLSDTQSAHVLAGEITRQGFIIAADEIFWLGGILFLFMCALVWLAKKPRHSHTHTPHVVE